MRLKKILGLSLGTAVCLWSAACSSDSSSKADPQSSSSEEVPVESAASDSTGDTTAVSSSSAAVPLSSAGPVNGLLVDDFEDGDGVSNLGTGWYTYDDSGNEGASTITTDTDADGNITASATENGSKFAFKVRYTLDKGGYAYEPYVGWGITVPDSLDIGKYAGVRYSYKGPAHYLHVETSDVTDYDVHLASAKKATEWTTVTVSFDDLTQSGWGIAVAFDPSHVNALSFQAKGSKNSVISDSLEIDNIYFVDASELPAKTADMTIRDPMEYNIDVGDITISNPLQDKAMKYLNKGVNFTNWLEEADGRFTGEFEFDENDVQTLSENGFKSLRLPIDLDLYVTNRDEFLSDTTGKVALEMSDSIFIVLDSFVNWTERYGMSFVIDYHEYDNSYNTTSAKDAQYLAMMANVWKAVAAHYAENSREDIFFELLNEPDMTNGKVVQDDWTVAAQGMIDSIRTVDTKHTIIFGDVQWYAIDKLVKRTPFTDDNIIYAIHSYDPYIFSHQGASWTEAASLKNIMFPYDKEKWSEYSSDFGVRASTASWIKTAVKNYYKTGSKGYIMSLIYKAKQWAVTNNVPIVWNEFGALRDKSDAQSVLNYLTAVREISDSLQVPWQHWGYTGGFAVIKDGKLIDGIADALDLK